MTKIDLRRGDFEGMHPKAKLFGFDEDKKLYTGDGVESINHQWTTWCACIGMLHLEVKEAQAVPEGFVLVKKELPEQIAEKMAIDRIDKPRHENDPVWREIAEQSYKDQVKSKKWEFWRDYKAMIEAQEQSHECPNP